MARSRNIRTKRQHNKRSKDLTLDLNAIKNEAGLNPITEVCDAQNTSSTFQKKLQDECVETRINTCQSLAILFQDPNNITQLQSVFPSLFAATNDPMIEVRKSACGALRCLLDHHPATMEQNIVHEMLPFVLDGFLRLHSSPASDIAVQECQTIESAELDDTLCKNEQKCGQTTEDVVPPLSCQSMSDYITEVLLLLLQAYSVTAEDSANLLASHSAFVLCLIDIIDMRSLPFAQAVDTESRTLASELLHALISTAALSLGPIRERLHQWAQSCCDTHLSDLLCQDSDNPSFLSPSLRQIQIYILGCVVHLLEAPQLLMRRGVAVVASDLLNVDTLHQSYSRIMDLLDSHFDIPSVMGAESVPVCRNATPFTVIEAGVWQLTTRVRTMDVLIEIFSDALDAALESGTRDSAKGTAYEQLVHFTLFHEGFTDVIRSMITHLFPFFSSARHVRELKNKAVNNHAVKDDAIVNGLLEYSAYVGDIAEVLDAFLATVSEFMSQLFEASEEMSISHAPAPIRTAIEALSAVTWQMLLSDLAAAMPTPHQTQSQNAPFDSPTSFQRYMVPRVGALAQILLYSCDDLRTAYTVHFSNTQTDLEFLLHAGERGLLERFPERTQCLLTALTGALIMRLALFVEVPLEVVQRIVLFLKRQIRTKEAVCPLLVAWESTNTLMDVFSDERWDDALALPLGIFTEMHEFYTIAPRSDLSWSPEDLEHVAEIAQNILEFGKYKKKIHKNRI